MKKKSDRTLRRIFTHAALSTFLLLSGTITASAQEDSPEQNNDETITVNDSQLETEIPEPSEGSENTAAESKETSSAKTITIGDTTFDPDADESSHWSEGRGWMNLGGQYVVMTDYDGSNETVEAHTDVLTLAVAGVNRIGTLKADCDIRIAGTGIVLINSIDIAPGKIITLHPNTALYNEGSAAVFLKQDDESYLLINGGVTGILDEDYALDNISLRIPKDSSLTFGATCVRTETWVPEGTQEAVTEVTRYTETVPADAASPVHENGQVTLENLAGRLVLGSGASLTVDSEASVCLKEVTDFTHLMPDYIKASLVVQGKLNIGGTVKGGIADVIGSGSLMTAGSDIGTILDADVILDTGTSCSKDLLLDKAAVTVYGNKDISVRTISLKIKDSVLYLKEAGIVIPQLDVSGSCVIGIDTGKIYATNEIKDIQLRSDAVLSILNNEHDYYTGGTFSGVPDRLFEDCVLEISGEIQGSGSVRVLAGCTEYTGTQTDILPAVPSGYASRVYVSGTDSMESTEYPLNMTKTEAESRLDLTQIPVELCDAVYTLVSDDILARSWDIDSMSDLEPLDRDGQEYTCASFLEAYGINIDNSDNPDSVNIQTSWPAVEVIYSGFSRELFWPDRDLSFSTDGVIMIRILICGSKGGQGGASTTNTNTFFTGSGQLGNPASGSVQIGGGTPVYENPAEPEDPTEEDPEPADNDDGSGDDTGTEQSGQTTPAPTASSAGTGWTPAPDVPVSQATPTPVTPSYAPLPAVTVYTVSFETDGGTMTAAQEVSKGSTAVRPEDPRKEGFIFGGWYKDKELTEIFNFVTPIRSDTTVYAKWIREEEPEQTVQEPAVSAEPEQTEEEKKANWFWLWVLLAVLGVAAVGTGIALIRKDE